MTLPGVDVVDVAVVSEAGEVSRSDRRGRIVFPNGTALELSSDDLLWTARMLEGEAGPNPPLEELAAVLWTLVHRYYWGSDTNAEPRGWPVSPGWGAFLRTFSQPINPRWSRGGVRCTPGAPGYDPRNCTEAQLARREALQSKSWDAIDPRVRGFVEAWLAGRTKSPMGVRGAINFGARGQRVPPEMEARRIEAPEFRNVFYASVRARGQAFPGSVLHAHELEKIYVEPIPQGVEAVVTALVPGMRRRVVRTIS